MGRDAGARRSCSHLLGDIKRSASNKRTTPLPTPPSNLKPASPPKINPWHRNGPGESSGQDLQQEPASTPEQSDHVAKDKYASHSSLTPLEAAARSVLPCFSRRIAAVSMYLDYRLLLRANKGCYVPPERVPTRLCRVVPRSVQPRVTPQRQTRNP